MLYPDDSTSFGQGLRFIQEYFLVACSLGDLVRRFRQTNEDWNQLPEKVAIQLNDTHPVDGGAGVDADIAGRSASRLGPGLGLNQESIGLHQPYPAAGSAREMAGRNGFRTCCRAIWRSSTKSIAASWMTFGRAIPGTKRRVASVSLIEEGPVRQVRMAQSGHRRLAQHQRCGGHSFWLAQEQLVSRISRTCSRNVSTTRPMASRHGVGCCWPTRRSRSHHRGHRRSLDCRSGRVAAAQTVGQPIRAFRSRSVGAKRQAKVKFADWLKTTTGQAVDPDTIFDCQIKRIHEYKRQLLNALRVVVLYNRLRANPKLDLPAADVSSSPARRRPPITWPSSSSSSSITWPP